MEYTLRYFEGSLLFKKSYFILEVGIGTYLLIVNDKRTDYYYRNWLIAMIIVDSKFCTVIDWNNVQYNSRKQGEIFAYPVVHIIRRILKFFLASQYFSM